MTKQIRFLAVIVEDGKITHTIYDDNDLNVPVLQDIAQYDFCQCGALIQIDENIAFDVMLNQNHHCKYTRASSIDSWGL